MVSNLRKFLKVAQGKHGPSLQPEVLNRELKASKQRTRRAIFQSLNRLASLGLNNFTNPIFENYAPKFFDFAIVQERVREIKKGKSQPSSQTELMQKVYSGSIF